MLKSMVKVSFLVLSSFLYNLTDYNTVLNIRRQEYLFVFLSIMMLNFNDTKAKKLFGYKLLGYLS